MERVCSTKLGGAVCLLMSSSVSTRPLDKRINSPALCAAVSAELKDRSLCLLLCFQLCHGSQKRERDSGSRCESKESLKHKTHRVGLKQKVRLKNKNSIRKTGRHRTGRLKTKQQCIYCGMVR